jgi:hypothetical protein
MIGARMGRTETTASVGRCHIRASLVVNLLTREAALDSPAAHDELDVAE